MLVFRDVTFQRSKLSHDTWSPWPDWPPRSFALHELQWPAGGSAGSYGVPTRKRRGHRSPKKHHTIMVDWWLPFQCSQNTIFFANPKSAYRFGAWGNGTSNMRGLYMAHYHSHPLRAGLVTKRGRSSLPKKSKKSSKPFSHAMNLQHLLKKCKKYIIKRDTKYYETFRFA